MNLAVAMYAFPRARIGAMRSGFLGAQEFRALLEAGSMEDIVSLLKLSGYGEELARLRSPGTDEVEEVLRRSLLRDYGKIYSSLYGFGKIFIDRVSKKYEVQALKGAVREKLHGPGSRQWAVIPFGSIKESLLERIRRSESMEEVAESLRLTEYYETFQSAMPRLKENGNPFTLFYGIDKYVYDRIAEKLKAVHGLDKRVSRMLIGTEIDFKNMMLVLRCRGLEEERIEKLLINYRYNLDDLALKALMTEGVDALTQESFPYQKALGIAMNAHEGKMSLLPLETTFEKYITRLNRVALTGFPFQLGAVIAYLNQKENEIRNLTVLLRGKKEGLGRAEIEDLLIITPKNT